MNAAFDEQWNMVEDPDTDKGEVTYESVAVECRYVIDQEERGHYEVIREYPTGGKDVEWKIDSPEVGGWKYYREGSEWSECPTTVPDDWPHDDVTMHVDVARWREYTAEELAEVAKKKIEAEEKLQDARSKAELIDALPDAVADLSEQVSDNVTGNADLADALADLSAVVSDIVQAK